jgi:hypothetical protein
MKRALLALALVQAACSSPPSAPTACTPMVSGSPHALARPLLVLERGGPTAALARIEGIDFVEESPDPVLGSDQFLLADGQGRPFIGVDDDGSVRVIDPEQIVIRQTFSVYPDHPPSAIPHGIYGVDVDADGNLWVSRDDVNEVAVIAKDGSLAGTVDLGGLDPDEHHPDMNGILIVGTRAFVALGFLTHGPGGGIASDAARRPGMIAVIDTTTRAIVGHIDLVGHNPVHRLIPIDDTMEKVIVATPGRHDSVDEGDGIDLVDLAAGKATQLISENVLGGSVDEVVWAGPDEAYAITLGPVPMINPTSVIRFDPQSGQVKQPALAQAPFFCDKKNGAGYVHVGLAVDGDVVVVGDHTPGAAAIRVFSRASGEELPALLPSVEAPWGLLPFGP